jgi:hypothetical protein
VAKVDGTGGADLLRGTTIADSILGFCSGDIRAGPAGRDRIDGGGNDIIRSSGAGGRDIVRDLQDGVETLD